MGEHLPSKCETQSSNPSTAKRKKEKKGKKKKMMLEVVGTISHNSSTQETEQESLEPEASLGFTVKPPTFPT
jgi:hypothetical protein